MSEVDPLSGRHCVGSTFCLSTVVEHTTHNLKNKDLNPGPALVRENGEKILHKSDLIFSREVFSGFVTLLQVRLEPT